MTEQEFTNKYISLRRSIIERDFSSLNDMQRKAVCTTEGALLVLAGAGSGKTTVLINRIVNLLRYGSGYESELIPYNASESDISFLEKCLNTELDQLSPLDRSAMMSLCSNNPVKPWEIIAITFTNKAAGELKERLTAAIGDAASDIWAHTFHSACMRILRRDGECLGYGNNFTVYDEEDKKKVICDILSELNLDDKKFDPRGIGSQISHAKDNLISPEEYKAQCGTDFYRRMLADIYERYEKRLSASNALDFDDIIVKTVKLLSEFPDVLNHYQSKFKYVLIDEYQDTNHAQYMLSQLLAGGYGNICAVGDDDQGIYKFRGASIENILEFEKNYKNARVIRLEQNYRSTQHILDAAGGVISHNFGRKKKTLWTENGSGEQVNFLCCESEDREAFQIASLILKEYSAGGKMSDFAVLYRNNVLSQPVEMAFKRNGIPYRIISGRGYFERAEVKDMLSYLWVINNHADNLRLKRIINVPARKIGDKTIETLEEISVRDGVSMFDAAMNASKYPELSRSASALEGFAQMIEELTRMTKILALPDFYNLVCERTDYVPVLLRKQDEESKKKIENVRELSSLFVEYCGRTAEPSLEGFLEEISLFTSIDKYDENAEAVSLMTIHSAKGLEFKNVFVCGMEEGVFPGFRASESTDELEEERRLCYVAMTRAKKMLYLTCAQRRLMYGQTKYTKPSRFIEEIPPQCLMSLSAPKKAVPSFSFADIQKSTPVQPSRFKLSARPSSSAVSQQHSNSQTSKNFNNIDFKVGDVVQHKAFGRGMVTMVSPVAGDALLEIAFDTVGTKKLMAISASQFMKRAEEQ